MISWNRRRAHALVGAIVFITAAVAGVAQTNGRPFEADSLTLAGLRWRNIGPANFMGRVSDVVGIPSPSKSFFMASAAGGIWKSTNNGVTWRPLFDNQRVISMGMLAIAPSDTQQIWAGTGEPNSRNSISPGGGIYKSTDGGTTWKLMGLEKTQTIGRIQVHPTNPNIVYVAALGAIWNSNPERGLYKTEDGGTTWQLIKFISDKAGFIDVQLDPSNPDVIWASSWERVRGPYFLKSGGPGSALWKSTDAGKTWTEVKGGGWPESTKGRISVAISQSNPKVMYTQVEADTLPNASDAKVRSAGAGATVGRAPQQQRLSGLYRSEDGGATWTRTNNENTRPFYYSQVRVHPKNPNRVYWSSTPVRVSNDGGKTVMSATVGVHVDHHGMWIDPNDPERMIVGNDGGVAITFDQGGNYLAPNSIPIAQFYNVSYDFSVPYRVCGGAQDNYSWCGPSRRRNGPITNAMWFSISGGDGFVTQNDPTDPNIIYSESQGGNIGRVDLRTGIRTPLVRPQYRPRYDMYEDSVIIERPDTAAPLTAAQRRRIADLRARQRVDSVMLDLRWNWNTPFLISPHNPTTLYFGANRVLKSTKRGDEMYAISPDLTVGDTMKIRVSRRATGGVTPDLTGAETYGTIVSLNESPVRPGILVAGTDDGKVWITWNDGGKWDDLTGRFPGVPAGTYVSRVEPSSHDSLTFFITFDNHRHGDFTPYAYKTSDGGKSFRSIAANLPTGGPDFVHVIRQDRVNKDLLFVGTDVGVYTSLNGGESWQRFMTGFPTTPVHDLAIHPRDNELIAATHGRSFYIVDIAPLQQLTPQIVAAEAHLFAPTTAFQWGEPPVEGQAVAQLIYEAPSPPYGANIVYRLTNRAQGQVRVVVQDVTGDTIRTVNGAGVPGLQRVTWGYQGKAPPRRPLSVAQKRDSTQQMNRITTVLDSLEKAGTNAQLVGRVRQAFQSGQFGQAGGAGGGGGGGGEGGGGGGGGGGGAAAAGRWNARPGEAAGQGGGGGGGGGAGGAALGALLGAMGMEGGQAGQPDFHALQQLVQLFNLPGQPTGVGGGFGGQNFMTRLGIQTGGFGAGGGGGGGGAAQTVSPGDYLVSITVNGKTLKQKLRVERALPGTAVIAAPESR